MAVEAITSFSGKPLLSVFYLGLGFSVGSLVLIAFLIIRRVAVGSVLLGWTSVIAVMLLVGGLIMLSLGVIGIYLSKIYLQIKSRPNVIIKKVYTGGN
jgi:putative glycosyltransferase